MIRAQQPTHSRRRSHPATVVSYILSAVLSILLAATPACNAFFAAPPLGASTISTSSSAGGERHRGAVLPTVRGAGSRVRRVPLGMSAVDVEQMGIVTVYHKQTCPHCKKALALLEDEYTLNVSRVDVLEGDDSPKKIKQMKTFSGRDTVPQIFFNSEHLGGNDDLQKLHAEGKLADMVAKVRAESPGMMKDTWYHPWY